MIMKKGFIKAKKKKEKKRKEDNTKQPYKQKCC